MPVIVQLVSVVLLWSNVRPPPLPDAPVARLPVMVQLVSVAVLERISPPPPSRPAVLLLMVQSVSVAEPPKTPAIPPAIRAAELPLTVQLVSVSWPFRLKPPQQNL